MGKINEQKFVRKSLDRIPQFHKLLNNRCIKILNERQNQNPHKNSQL